jgi:hypothetical protein
MTQDDEKIVVGIIAWIICIACGIGFRLYQCEQAKKRLRPYATNAITSQTRPLIIYHVPVSLIQEESPPSYNQVVAN